MSAPTEARPPRRDLVAAVIVGLTLAAIFLITLFTHRAAFSTFVGLIIVAGVVEASHVLRQQGVRVAVPVVLVTAVVVMVAAYRMGPPGTTVGLAVLFAGAVLWQLFDRGREDVIRRVGATLLMGVWIPILGSFAVLLAGWPVDPELAVLGTIGAAAVTDVAAYAWGSQIGRTKLAPSVSPSKTWEGLLGGIATTVVLAAIILPRLGDLFTWSSASILALTVGLATTAGDLVESMVKRDVGIKDLGGLLPGHGGILDRVDGIVFALPVGFYTLMLLG